MTPVEPFIVLAAMLATFIGGAFAASAYRQYGIARRLRATIRAKNAEAIAHQARRHASAAHARAVQLDRERAKRDATTRRLEMGL
ncbi:MAG: hypothetical protein ABW043_16985 [Devosia sp.]|uniref:hypothetical protein n=1 Tax=Devosia sp. TaxID=1871048 RepID=UPI0033941B86